MTPETLAQAREIAASLSKAQADAMGHEERTHLEACDLNALGLVHLDVLKDRYGALIDMRSRLTPLGQAVAAVLRYNAMGYEERAKMKAAQRASFIRSMTTPCEHGVLDFEQCGDCRATARPEPQP